MGYTYTINNCGNTVFNNLAIIDDNGTPDFAGDDFTVASGISLNPGETKSYHVVVTLPVPTCSNTSGDPFPSRRNSSQPSAPPSLSSEGSGSR